MTWSYARDGRRLGPFTADQLRQLAAAGAVRPYDLVRDGGPRVAVTALFTLVGVAATVGDPEGVTLAPAVNGSRLVG